MTRRTTIICYLAGRKTCYTGAVGNGLSRTLSACQAQSTLCGCMSREEGASGVFCLCFLRKVLGKISLLPGLLPRAGLVHTTL